MDLLYLRESGIRDAPMLLPFITLRRNYVVPKLFHNVIVFRALRPEGTLGGY